MPQIQFANCYGKISLTEVSVDINPNNAPEKITEYATEIFSDGVSTDMVAGTLTINSDGAYDIFIHVSASVEELETYTVYLALNDAEYGSADTYTERKTLSYEITRNGFIQNLVAGDALSLYVSSSNAAGAEFTPNALELKVVKVGT